MYYALINLNLETNSIVQIQKDLQKQYLEVLLKTYAELFNSIIDKDDFTPLVVSSQEEEFEILQAFPLNAGNFSQRKTINFRKTFVNNISRYGRCKSKRA